MKDIVELLKTFTVEEWKQFRDFVKSPIYNKKKKIIELWDVLNRAYPTFETIPSEEKLQKRLKITNRYLGQLFRALKKLIDQFLVFLAIQADESHQQLLLLQQYQAKTINQSTIKKGLDKHRTTFGLPSTQKGEQSFLYSYLFETIEYKWFTNSLKRDANINIKNRNKQLDTYYIYEKLRCLIDGLSLERFLSVKVDKNEVGDILNLAQKPSFQQIPEIQLLAQLLHSLYEKDEKTFQCFLDNLATHSLKISKDLLIDLYNLANNFCYSQIIDNQVIYLQYSFEITKKIEQEGLLDIEDNAKFPHIYANYTTAASKIGAFEWATFFTEKYKTSLPISLQDVYHLNLATIAFYQKNYNQALRHSYKVPEIDAFYTINHRILVIKSLYYLGELEALQAKIDSFRKYIDYKRAKSQANHILLEYLDSYHTFTLLLESLRRINAKQNIPNFDPNHGLLILQNIEERLTSNVVYRQWLLEQIQILKVQLES